MLKYNILKTAPVTLIALQGRFDSSGAIQFEEEFKKNTSLFPILNFSNVTYLSSAGIRVLLQSEKSLRLQNSKLILSEVASTIKQVLEITGLLQQFTLIDSDTEAIKLALNMQNSVKDRYHVVKKNVTYSVQPYNTKACKTDFWMAGKEDKDGLIAVNLDEFEFAIGTGGLGTTRQEANELFGKMIITKNFIGLISENKAHDYILSKNPSETFFYINSAVNFSGKPNILVKTISNQPVSFGELLENSFTIISESSDKPLPAAGFLLIADICPGSESKILSAGIINDRYIGEIPDGILPENSHLIDDSIFYKSIGVIINSSDGSNDDIEDCVYSLLKDDNISEISEPSKDLELLSAKLWMFIPDFHDAIESRLKIGFDIKDIPDEFEILTRNIYSDCSRIKLHQLHGGFSAKTFQVYGYDKKGIRILPTVLKLAKRSTIRREVLNYEENVRRYILNNSTSVMGSFYYGGYGGVRYNFVGITGPDSKISWLTNYYKEKPAEELLPLFDRVFTDILRPWYGQPRLENFHPYKEHNPTKVFFPELFEKCEEELEISADVDSIYIDELEREIVNPYWFLKYGYKEKEKYSLLWYKCICHGDLNMQNILLDEIKNIYIIDYSETSLRNAVADFARLEPIFKFEFPEINQKEMKHLIKFEEGLLAVNKLGDIPLFTYTGSDPFIEKAYKMICRLRQYANTVTIFENDLIPYLLAVLEWTYSVVCYQSVDKMTKRYSAVSAALICEKILQLEKHR